MENLSPLSFAFHVGNKVSHLHFAMVIEFAMVTQNVTLGAIQCNSWWRYRILLLIRSFENLNFSKTAVSRICISTFPKLSSKVSSFQSQIANISKCSNLHVRIDVLKCLEMKITRAEVEERHALLYFACSHSATLFDPSLLRCPAKKNLRSN